MKPTTSQITAELSLNGEWYRDCEVIITMDGPATINEALAILKALYPGRGIDNLRIEAIE